MEGFLIIRQMMFPKLRQHQAMCCYSNTLNEMIHNYLSVTNIIITLMLDFANNFIMDSSYFVRTHKHFFNFELYCNIEKSQGFLLPIPRETRGHHLPWCWPRDISSVILQFQLQMIGKDLISLDEKRISLSFGIKTRGFPTSMLLFHHWQRQLWALISPHTLVVECTTSSLKVILENLVFFKIVSDNCFTRHGLIMLLLAYSMYVYFISSFIALLHALISQWLLIYWGWNQSLILINQIATRTIPTFDIYFLSLLYIFCTDMSCNSLLADVCLTGTTTNKAYLIST